MRMWACERTRLRVEQVWARNEPTLGRPRKEPAWGTSLSEEQFFTRNELSRGIASLCCERFHERDEPWIGRSLPWDEPAKEWAFNRTSLTSDELTAKICRTAPPPPPAGCMGLERRLKHEKMHNSESYFKKDNDILPLLFIIICCFRSRLCAAWYVDMKRLHRFVWWKTLCITVAWWYIPRWSWDCRVFMRDRTGRKYSMCFKSVSLCMTQGRIRKWARLHVAAMNLLLTPFLTPWSIDMRNN